MARKQRQIERVEFSADLLAPVVERMVRLAGAGGGWINLLPKIGEIDERPTSLGFITLFGGSGTGVTMCTWVPASHDRGEPNPARLGITHSTGHRVVAELQSRGLPIPTSWFVEQDHPRRGLVVRIPYDEPHEQVLEWAMRAIEALGSSRVTNGWRADIYLPTER